MTEHPKPVLCSQQEFVSSQFDFIVVGGGTAGLLVAARLSEDGKFNVGVLEAGVNRLDDPLINVPNLFPQVYNRKGYDWMLKSVPQKHVNGLEFSLPRGKMLGGTSAINFMQYTRGTKSDYEELAKILDSDEWSWNKFLPYMQKSERLEATDRPNVVDAAHGRDGAIHTSLTRSRIPIESTFLEACQEIAGFEKRPFDATNGTHDSFYNSLNTVDRSERKGTRSYAASGFLLPNLNRQNLKVLTEANVERVSLDTSKAIPVAEGVYFWHSGTRHFATAKREVIVCAGTHKTPQVLELSGIGDPEVLRGAGVDCVVPNSLVGENMQDHTAIATTFELADGGFSVDAFANPTVLRPFMDEYQTSGGGPLASPPSGMGFLSYASLVSSSELEATIKCISSSAGQAGNLSMPQQQLITKRLRDPRAAAIQMLFVPARIDVKEGRQDQSKFIRPALSGNNHVTAIMAFQYSLSRGSVHITSNNPEAQPAIDPSFLSHPADLDILRAVLPFLNKVSLFPTVKSQLHENFSAAKNFGLGDKEAEEQYIREHVGTEHHPVGTAAMGDVVDQHFKVNGVIGLRCVDASVLPIHISGNPMATVYGLAEKAAELILEAHTK